MVCSTLRFLTSNPAAAQFGMTRCVISCVKAPAPTVDAQALKKKPNPKLKCEAGSPSAAFISPSVRNAPKACVFGAVNIRAAPTPAAKPTNPPIMMDWNKIVRIGNSFHTLQNIL